MNDRLEKLRDYMRRVNVDAVVIPGTDPHQSEYVSDHYKFRDWLTGFTGSNGTAVVTLDKAALWTDSRYFLQAAEELADSGFDLVREGDYGDPSLLQWLNDNLDEDDVIALDGRLFTINEVNRYDRFCGERGIMLATDFAPADYIWADRPPRPAALITIHDEKFAGESLDSKVNRVMDAVEEMGATSMLITALDDIAWLYNLRGEDVLYTPVVLAYAFISRNERSLFVDPGKITPDVKDYLKSNGVQVREYDDIIRYLERKRDTEQVLLDPDRVSDALVQALPSGKIWAASPVAALKAVKNAVQQDGFRRAHERDAVAMVKLMRWIEQAVPSGNVTEVDIAEKAAELRREVSGDLYRGESFALIAGYNEHGAIVHYEATPDTAATLRPEGLLLIDTGGQYPDGTTDLTRTIALGEPTDEQRRHYTLVLKGHLALMGARFPEGTTGVQLDALARMPLWQQSLNYGHGTGHGVGQYLGCHEGPQSIRTNLNPTPLQVGMVVSDEPGLYLAGRYGIRIENLLLVVEGDKSDEFGTFLRFEPLTLLPYDKRLIDEIMLTATERDQITAYNRLVADRLLPLLDADDAAWLRNKLNR